MLALPVLLLLLLVTTAHPASAQDAATPIATEETAFTPDEQPPDDAPQDSSADGDGQPTTPTLRCDANAGPAIPVGGRVAISCSIEIGDRETYLVIARSSSAGWSLQFEETGASDPIAVAANEGPLPQMHSIVLHVSAPATVNASAQIELSIESLAGEHVPAGSFTTALTTVVPVDWTLACAAIAPSTIPGSAGDITCTIPDAAWAVRGEHPTAWHGSAVGEATDILAPTFTLTTLVPCPVSPAESNFPTTIVAELAEGIILSDEVVMPLDRAAVDLHLEVGAVAVNEAVWSGSAYLPTTLTVDLTVTGATTPCGDIPWTLHVTALSLTREGMAYQPLSIVSDGSASSGSVPFTTIADAATVPPLATGRGDGTIHLTLAIILPPEAPGGEYDGSLGLALTPDAGVDAILPGRHDVMAQVTR